jgi:hypothetical protein
MKEEDALGKEIKDKMDEQIEKIFEQQEKDYAKLKTSEERKEADIRLRNNINKVLPGYLHVVGWIYYYSVRIFGRFYL